MPAHDQLNARKWARAGLILGAIVSVAMNGASNWRVTKAGDKVTWAAPWADGLYLPEFVKLIVTMALPIILLVVVEVIARSRWPKGRGWLVGPLGVVAAGATMAVLSFLEVYHLWSNAGVEKTVAACLAIFPDFVMTTCSVALLAATVRETEQAMPETPREIAPEMPVATWPETSKATPEAIVEATPEATVEETVSVSPGGPVATLEATRQETRDMSPGDTAGDEVEAWVEDIEKALAEVARRQESGDAEKTETSSSTTSPRVATDTRKATPRRRKATRQATSKATSEEIPSIADLRALVEAHGDAVTVEYVVAERNLGDADSATRRAISNRLYKARQAMPTGDTEDAA